MAFAEFTFSPTVCLLMQIPVKFNMRQRSNRWKFVVPHESEADLEGRRVVLIIDDYGEEKRGDEVGQGDDN